MKIAALATLLVAASAVRLDRNLGEEAKDEKTTWDAYAAAVQAQAAATQDMINKRADEVAQENTLKGDIANVNAQETVVQTAQETTNSKRNDAFTATKSTWKALDGYIAAILADPLVYKP